MKAIHYGGDMHGKILHAPSIPGDCPHLIHGISLVIQKGTPDDQTFKDTISEWRRLLSDPDLFHGSKRFKSPKRSRSKLAC